MADSIKRLLSVIMGIIAAFWGEYGLFFSFSHNRSDLAVERIFVER